MRRRDFTLLGGTAAVWPLVAWAQQSQHMRRIGVLMNADNADARANYAAFLQALQQLGWSDNVRIDTRWARGQASEIRKYAGELVGLTPDVIVATGTSAMGPLLQATRFVPIVFANVVDPVGSGFVKTVARPGGNATGFVQFEYSFCGKWPQFLKQIAPNITRVAVLRDANIPSGIGQFAVIQSVAPSLGIEVSAINEFDASDIEREITEFAQSPNGGLIITSSGLSVLNVELIIRLAAKHKLPAFYYRRYFVDQGGLMSYGCDIVQQFRAAADYVDRILKGAKPTDLPVQAPAKYELVINLKTAKALGLEVPAQLQQIADEIIE